MRQPRPAAHLIHVESCAEQAHCQSPASASPRRIASRRRGRFGTIAAPSAASRRRPHVCRAPQVTRRRIYMTATGQAGTHLDIARSASRKGSHPAHSLPAHDHGRGLGPSDLVPFRGRNDGRDIFPRHEIRSRQSQLARGRPLRALQGTRRADSLRRAGRGRGLSGFAPDDAAAIFERTRRPSDAAHSRRGRGHRLAGPGAFGGRGLGAGRAHREIARARFRADGRRRNGGRPGVGSGGVRRALRASTI